MLPSAVVVVVDYLFGAVCLVCLLVVVVAAAMVLLYVGASFFDHERERTCTIQKMRTSASARSAARQN